jgi:hypothetical protein
MDYGCEKGLQQDQRRTTGKIRCGRHTGRLISRQGDGLSLGRAHAGFASKLAASASVLLSVSATQRGAPLPAVATVVALEIIIINGHEDGGTEKDVP